MQLFIPAGIKVNLISQTKPWDERSSIVKLEHKLYNKVGNVETCFRNKDVVLAFVPYLNPKMANVVEFVFREKQGLIWPT